MRFADIRTEWRVDAIEQTLHRKADLHEVNTLSGDVGSLERANRELRSEVDGLRAQLQTLQDSTERLTNDLTTLMERGNCSDY
jgi:predicted  nucleic acid-binding Zn-ribbon protein